MKIILKDIFDRHVTLKYIIKNICGKGCIKNIFKTNYQKKCLLIYITYPFVKNVEFFHQVLWQVVNLSTCISKYGYNIDVIDYDNTVIRLSDYYDLVINIAPCRNRVFKIKMNRDCKLIAYFTGSNPSFQNNAEQSRLNDLENRKGVKLKSRCQVPLLTKEIEGYTAAFMIGNNYNWNTFSEYKMPPVYFIKNTGNEFKYTFDDKKKNKKYFMYFGSSCQVSKGLDILLDIFAEKNFPCDLFVCGRFKDEEDFERLYSKELYETNNIHPIGFLNVDSDLFREITSMCVYSVLISGSEGLAGSVLTTMSAGLINICSKECGLEDDEVINLESCDINTVRDAILEYSQKDMEWIKKESYKEYMVSQERYGKKNFTESVEYGLSQVLGE